MFQRLRAYEENSWRTYDEQTIVKKNALTFSEPHSLHGLLKKIFLADTSQEAYSQEISLLLKPLIKKEITRVFGQDIGQLILGYLEWFDLALDSGEKLTPLTIYLGNSNGDLSYKFITNNGTISFGTILSVYLPENFPTSIQTLIQSKDTHLVTILKDLSLPRCDFGYDSNQLMQFFHFGMVLDYIESNHQHYETMFHTLALASDASNDFFRKVTIIAQDCIAFYHLHLDYLLKNEKMASLFVKNMHAIIKGLFTMTGDSCRKYLIQHLGLVFTRHLTQDYCAWDALFPRQHDRAIEKISYPFKQALLQGITGIIEACAHADDMTLTSAPPLWNVYSLLLKKIDNTNQFHVAFGSDYDDSNDDTLCHYFFKYVDYFSIRAVYKNTVQQEAFNQLKTIAQDIIGLFHCTNIKHSTVAVKALSFAIKLELTYSPQNRDQLKIEYDKLHKELTSHPRLQKLAAAFQIFFGTVIEILFSGLCQCRSKAFSALLSNGLFRWQHANLSQTMEQISSPYFSRQN